MRLRNYIAILLIGILLLSVDFKQVQASQYILNGYKKLAESSKLELYFNEEDSSLAVKNKVSDYIWSSSVSDTEFDTSKLNKKIKGSITSLFNITYTNIVTGKGAIMSSNLTSLEPEMAFESLSNGIKGTYYFPKVSIGFDVEITLDDTGLNVKIPGDSIIEESDMKLVSIEMMPYFGAATDQQEGYFFYPDGSGALMEFTDLNHFGESKKTWNIYGTDISKFFNWDMMYESLMLPIYGVKKGNDGFLAVIEDGAASSNISLSPSTNIVKLNNICSEFVYRNSFNDPRVKTRMVKQYDTELIKMDHSVRYLFLGKEEADYSGMANSYREYLLENQKVGKQIKKGENIPLGLDLFMGINEQGLLFNKFIPMTTFKEAQTILQNLLDQGVGEIKTQLKGWTKKGYYTEPVYFPPSRKLGGKSGLKKLAAFTSSNEIDLYLQMDPVFAESSNGGFSKRNDVVYLGNGTILTDRSNEYFFLSPAVVLEKFQNHILPNAKAYPITGMSFDGLGYYLYYDYNEKHFYNKSQTKEIWTEIVDKSMKELGGVMVRGGNEYMLNHVQSLSDIPMEDSGYYFTTKSVPFYQMVVHGLLPYTSEVAGNLSPSFEKEKLKWIEKGYMPYFELTYKPADLLKYTEYNFLFTSTYSDWIQKAADVYNEFNENLGDIWSEYIVRHEEVKEDIIVVTYSNGTKVIINYTDKDSKVGKETVKALDYLVIKGGE